MMKQMGAMLKRTTNHRKLSAATVDERLRTSTSITETKSKSNRADKLTANARSARNTHAPRLLPHGQLGRKTSANWSRVDHACDGADKDDLPLVRACPAERTKQNDKDSPHMYMKKQTFEARQNG